MLLINLFKRKIFLVFCRCYQNYRVLKYLLVSDIANIRGKVTRVQPLLITGFGTIEFGTKVSLGCIKSPAFYSGYGYLEARSQASRIVIGSNVHINNSCTIISNGTTITIGDNTLIGAFCQIVDSDFHGIDPLKRSYKYAVNKPVTIGRNVFVGNNVQILKGVHIGDNSVIATGSIVTQNIPANVIAGGIPAKTIRALTEVE